MDDAYVIMGAYQTVDPKLSREERMAEALGRAGVSITITSVTDFAAFLTGTITVLPALRVFCLYAAVGKGDA